MTEDLQNIETMLTIVTITYNREADLLRLYNSLKSQDRNYFQWYVVDDGSTDGTVPFIQRLRSKNEIKINLFARQNHGKYKEINYILPKINTPLMLFLDSDDYLVPNGINLIHDYYQRAKGNSEVGSLIFEHGETDGDDKLSAMKSIDGEFIGKRYYTLIKKHSYGDYADVFSTKAISDFKFPEFKNEKFMSEGPLYYQFSQHYCSLFIPKILTVGNYESQGLTKSIRSNQIKNYRGTLYETQLYLNNDTPLYFRFKKGILFDYVAIHCEESFLKLWVKSHHKCLLLSCLLPALIIPGQAKNN